METRYTNLLTYSNEDAGADINAPDPDGRSALMYSVHYEHFEATALLIMMGANIDHQASGIAFLVFFKKNIMYSTHRHIN